MLKYIRRYFLSEKNLDVDSVRSFGNEWSRFKQDKLNPMEHDELFNNYFQIFPYHLIDKTSTGFDMGCGSGRWAIKIAPLVRQLICIDASNEALNIAKLNLKNNRNVKYINASVNNVQLECNSQDFGYSLGVLHHIPDTRSALNACTSFLKPGAPFLLYLYYSFDNKNIMYRMMWHLSEIFRFFISRAPNFLKNIITDFIALFVYLPLARMSKFLNSLGISVDLIPLSFYMNLSFYTMRTDSRDRFGTKLEQRFSKMEIERMMINAGLEDIIFSDVSPFWCAVGFKKLEA